MLDIKRYEMTINEKSLDSKLFGINILISIFFILSVLFLYPEIDTEEDGLIEWLQSLFIAFSMILFFYHAFRVKEIGSKLASFGLSLLSLTFLLRELDVETLDIPYYFIVLGSGTGRNILLISLWLILVALTLKYKTIEKEKVLTFLFTSYGQILMLSAFMLVLGAMMDKNIFSLQNEVTRFFEELLELLGYVYLFFASILRVKR